MKILLISRQFSHSFRCIKKSTNFQNHFNQINNIFPKHKQRMSESKKQLKTTSTPKTSSQEDRERQMRTDSRNTSHRSVNNETQYRGQTLMYGNYSMDANINSYHFPNAYDYRQFGHTFNSHPSHYQPVYYQMNGGVYYPLSPAYNQPTYYEPPPQYRSQTNTYYNTRYSPPKRMTSQSNGPTSDEQMSERVTKFRQMIKSRSSDEKDSNEFRFSLMTYNILSQDLLDYHSTLYEHCQSTALSWPQRGHRIIKEILDSDCDIICLQEVHFHHFEQLLMPSLKQKGYDFVFKQRTGGKMDGCAIFYKENKFSLLSEIKLDFMRRDLSSVMDRDNIAIIVELKPKECDTKLIVANTHLLYNPKRGDVKLCQIRLLMAEIHRIAMISQKDGVFDYNPIILCGDLNSEPNSLLYKFITNGLADFNGHRTGDISGQKEGFGRGLEVEDYHLKLFGITSDTRFESSSDNQTTSDEKMSIKHNFKLKSVVSRFDINGNKLISSSNRIDSCLVDYIFYDYSKLKVRAFQRLLTQNQLAEIGYIPNRVLGSDHLSLKAIFSIV